MARFALCQAVVLLLCLKVTRAGANQRDADEQHQHDEGLRKILTNTERGSLNDMIDEYNYVYIDDADLGVSVQNGNQGASTQEPGHEYADPENDIHVEQCPSETMDGDGRSDSVCDIEIQGADEQRKGRIPFGIDGLYRMIGCFRGFPVYKRDGATRLERRILWFSHVFEDWDVIAGDFTTDQINRPPLMYGASSPVVWRPELLESDAWQVMHIYHPARADLAYVAAAVTVQCVADGKPHAYSGVTPEEMRLQDDAATALRAAGV